MGTRHIQYRRTVDGLTETHCGRYSIVAITDGYSRPTGYEVFDLRQRRPGRMLGDPGMGKVGGTFRTLREAKDSLEVCRGFPGDSLQKNTPTDYSVELT